MSSSCYGITMVHVTGGSCHHFTYGVQIVSLTSVTGGHARITYDVANAIAQPFQT
jgi:hypothetical protein